MLCPLCPRVRPLISSSARTTDAWYSAAGALNGTTTLASGNHLGHFVRHSSLKRLKLVRPNFYYHLIFETASSTLTPVLTDVQLYFTEPPPVEYTAVVDTGGVGDYSSLSAWESAIQSDLTNPTTRVFGFVSTTTNGLIPDGSTVIGLSSGATAVAKHVNSITVQGGTAQALFTGIFRHFPARRKSLYFRQCHDVEFYLYNRRR